MTPSWSPARAAPTRWRCSRRRVFEAREPAPAGWSGVTVDHGLQDGSADHAARVVDADGDDGRGRDRGRPGAGRGRWSGARGGGSRGALCRARRDGRPLRVRDGAARAHPRRPGRDRAARTRPRLRRPLAGRDAPFVRPLPPAAARRLPRRHGHRLPGRGHRVLGRPPQRRPGVHPGARPRPGAAGARGGARARRRRDARPHRRPAPRRHRGARLAGRGGLRTRSGPTTASTLRPLYDEHRAIASRVLRLAAVAAGAIDSELFHVHVTRPARARWSGTLRGDVQLPGHVTAYRDGDHLLFRPTAVES